MPNHTRKRKHDHKTDSKDDERKNKYRSYDEAAQAEEEQLTKILFGGATTFLKSLEEAEKEEIKTLPDSGIEDDSDDYEMVHKPAWTDEDDDGIDIGQALDAQGRSLPHGGVNDRSKKYRDLLKHKFESIHGTPKWATATGSKEESDDDDILKTCGFLKNHRGAYLPGSLLEYKKVKDLNCSTYNEGPYINSVEFFNNSSVALVAGQSGISTLFAVDGKANSKLHSIGFEHFPIFCSKVIENNNEAIFGSRYPYIYSYDLINAKPSKISLPSNLTTFKKFVVSPDQKMIAGVGKFGEIHLLNTKSKERMGILKQNSDVTSLCFNARSSSLYAHSDTGEVTIFDLNMRKVQHRFTDEGCLQGTTIAITSSDQFLATGSAQGVVNIYDTNSVFNSSLPKPRKTLMNLTTAITSLEFNPTSEILAFASVDVLNSVKFCHLNSFTTFKNFPSFETRFGHVNVLNFSPSSGYVAFGNKKSCVSLYRLINYKNY